MKPCGPVCTDETLRELAVHGTEQFPFTCYHSRLGSGPCACVPWHWHREIELVLVNTGVAHCLLGNEHLVLARGEGVFIHSGIIHSFESPQNANIISILFTPEFIAPEHSTVYSKFIAPFSAGNRSHALLRAGVPWQGETIADMETLAAIVRNGSPTAELAIHEVVCRMWSRLFAHLDEIQTLEPEERSALMNARLRRMIAFIEANFTNKVSLSEIAADASISKSEALRCFKRGVHTTPIDYVNRYRLNYARTRLLSTTQPITEIAVEAGFSSTAYFDRLFRRCFGLNPALYRKSQES